MKIKKERKGGSGEASSQRTGYHMIECPCPGCGKISQVRFNSEGEKKNFVCKCGQRFSVTLPGDFGWENWQ